MMLYTIEEGGFSVPLQQYFNSSVVASFIGGGNRVTQRNPLTNVIT